MTKTEEDIIEERVNRPIGARIKAVPGWRVVMFNVVKELDDKLQQITIEVKPVMHWALDGPVMLPNSGDAMDNLFGGFFSFMSAPKSSPVLWPLDVSTGRRLGSGVHRLVPPSDDTDEQLIEAAKQYCAETVEKSKMSLSELLAHEAELKKKKNSTP